METRDILNFNMEVIGQLTLPENTPEEVWQQKLSEYRKPPPTIEQIALEEVKKAMDFGKDVIAYFGAKNVAAGLNAMQLLEIANKLSAVQALLLAGAITPALVLIEAVQPDEIITQDLKDEFISKLKGFLGA